MSSLENHTWVELRLRLPRLFLGATICGVGIGGMVVADLGLGPWDVFHQGLERFTGVTIGIVSIIVGLLLLLLWLPLRVVPGVGTLVNAIVIGLVIDLVVALMDTPSTMSMRILLMVGGPVLFGVGSGFYIGAGLGPGPRDGIMVGLARRGYSIAVVRTGLEVAVLIAGGLLGGRIGVGTVLYAFGVGPVVHAALPRLSMDREGGGRQAPPAGRGPGESGR